jgi:L-serine dehydratase
VQTSLFDLFKIGIGPSSSHTVGPMRAALEFVQGLDLPVVASVRAELYGSLALTGIGHATDTAILLGLSGETPAGVDPDRIAPILAAIRESKSISLLGRRPIAFDEPRDLIFHRDMVLPGHPNAMRFTAYDADRNPLTSAVYYSVGGGFIQKEGQGTASQQRPPVPWPFRSGAELLAHGIPFWRIMLDNETAWRPEAEVRAHLALVWRVMEECVQRGLKTEGILPGGLNVRRRAPRLAARLIERGSADPLAVMDWVNIFAMAVNEENAAGGRVVTAPTNGAAGIIPAVGHYYLRWHEGANAAGIFRYLLTAGAIGVLYKENASISGAEVGCQGEVGVACSMAAAGLVAALEGTSDQVEHAAEIGMEHNLGMTCDPIGGLVQIPCIERNAIGAVKAINACRMSMHETGGHKVQLDQVIKTMYQTGLDMQSRYKETSLAGLAVNAVEC